MTYSIITINYNNKEGLQNSIESVIQQSFQDYEFIVIDGNSNDGSVSLLKKYDKKIDFWVSEPDKGIYNAMNKGIKHAHGDYLIFMNSGDFFYNKDVLKDVIPFLNNDIIEGKLYKTKSKTYTDLPTLNPTMMLFYKGGLDHQACFIRRTLFNHYLYDESLQIAADWKFFLQKIVFESHTLSYMPVIVASYEGGGISEDKYHETIHKEERNKVLSSLLPPLVLADYERYSNKESPVLDLIPDFNRTNRLHKLIVITIRFILCLYKFFNSRK